MQLDSLETIINSFGNGYGGGDGYGDGYSFIQS